MGRHDSDHYKYLTHQDSLGSYVADEIVAPLKRRTAGDRHQRYISYEVRQQR